MPVSSSTAVCWSLISLLLVYQMLLLVPPTFLLSLFLLRFDHCPACLSVYLSVSLFLPVRLDAHEAEAAH